MNRKPYLRMANIHIVVWTAVVLLLAVSCKKEAALRPYTDIINFTVTSPDGEPIKAAIDGDSIVIYWPIGKERPETLTPVIHVAEGATISPASGEEVSLREAIQYTVKAETGDSKTYRLHVPNNKPKPYVNTFGGLNIKDDKQFIFKDWVMSFRGDYYDASEGGTAVFYIDAAGNEIPAEVQHISELGANIVAGTLGTFSGIKIESNGHTIFYETVFDVVENPFSTLANPEGSTTAKPGDELTFSGTNLDKVDKFEIGNYLTNTQLELDIVTATAESITVKLPSDLPIGEYNLIVAYYPAGEYNDAGNTASYLQEHNLITIGN